MSTLEDVFYLHERNSSHYLNCNSLDKVATCIDYFVYSNQCMCIDNILVLPKQIGFIQDIRTGGYDGLYKLTHGKKCYIKPGDECPICYEPIFMKSNAYLTKCGHGFHKNCIFKYYSMKVHSSRVYPNISCPICRKKKLGYDLCENIYKYNCCSEKYNRLDSLENFEFGKEYMSMILTLCDNGHHAGMIRNCYACSIYRHIGLLNYYQYEDENQDDYDLIVQHHPPQTEFTFDVMTNTDEEDIDSSDSSDSIENPYSETEEEINDNGSIS